MSAVPGLSGTGWEPHLLRLVGEIDHYAIFMLDVDGRVVTWNHGAEVLKGYGADEIIGRHFEILHTPEDRERDHPEHLLARARRDGRCEEEGWRVRKDGTRFWASVTVTAVHADDGAVTGFGKVTRDLTGRREAEEELRRYRTMVTGVRDYAIFLLDETGRIATWNDGAARIKGYTADEIVGRHFSAFFPPEDAAADRPRMVLEHAARHGKFEEEQWRVRKDGSRFWAGVLLTALRDDTGTVTGFAKVTRDLTERRAAEQELTRLADASAEEAQALEAFASTAAHDLQEPLRTMTGYAELLARRHGESLPEDAAGFLAEIQRSGARMSELISDLLEHARSGTRSETFAPVALDRAVADVLETVAGSVRERGTAVRVEIPGDAVVLGDERSARLVLQNLISNAVKFAGPDDPEVCVAAAPAPGGWTVTVMDNGPGIPEGGESGVFEPFVRLHPGMGGTGLGLSIAQRIAERHGSRIEAGNRPEGGARFSWTLAAPG